VVDAGSVLLAGRAHDHELWSASSCSIGIGWSRALNTPMLSFDNSYPA